jgi:two-component system NtrC family sensor kinase
MKSKVASLSQPTGCPPVDYQAFFEALEAPAAVCRPGWGVQAANPAFQALCGGELPQGSDLRERLPELPAECPVEGSSLEVLCRCGTPGRLVRLVVSHRGGVLALLGRPVEPERSPGAEEPLLELTRKVAGVTSEEMLVAAVARGMKSLFPGAFFCVRVVDPRTLELSSLYAEGRLLPGARGALVLKKSAV